MGFFSNLLMPANRPEPKCAPDADDIWEQIERADGDTCRVSKSAALMIRKKLAEDLGRSFGDTPLPGSINGTEIIVDSELIGITVEAE